MTENPWSEALQQSTQEMLESGNFMAHPVTNEVCFKHHELGFGYMNGTDAVHEKYDLHIRASGKVISFPKAEDVVKAGWVLD